MVGLLLGLPWRPSPPRPSDEQPRRGGVYAAPSRCCKCRYGPLLTLPLLGSYVRFVLLDREYSAAGIDQELRSVQSQELLS